MNITDIFPDGSQHAKVLNAQRTLADFVDPVDETWPSCQKVAIHINFPGIGSNVSQRALIVEIEDYEESCFKFVPDQSHVEILVPANKWIHLTLAHLATDGQSVAHFKLALATIHDHAYESSGLSIEVIGTVTTTAPEPELTEPEESIEPELVIEP